MDNSSDEPAAAWQKKPRERIFPENMSSSDNINNSASQNQIDSSQQQSNDDYIRSKSGRRAITHLNHKRLSIIEELAFINSKYKSILQSHEERILYRPIKAYKLKPKNIMRMFQTKWRYVMFTNRRLYTLRPEPYEVGNILIAERLIANKIDIDFLSHLIFIPKFIFDSYEMFDVNKLKNDNNSRRQAIVKEMKQKRCKIIIGFKQPGFQSHYKFNESDIALETTLWTVLQIIHCCQLVNMQELQNEFSNEQTIANQASSFKRQLTAKSSQKQFQSGSKYDQSSDIRESRFNRQNADIQKTRNRGTGSKRSLHAKVDQIQYFPVFIVKNKKYSSDAFDERQSIVVQPRSSSSRRNSSRSKSGMRSSLTRIFSCDRENYNLKQFYRGKNSDAEIKIGENPEVLQRVDSKYYCELFWALEPQSQPEIIQAAHQEILDMQFNEQKLQQTHDSQQVDDNKNNQTGIFGQQPIYSNMQNFQSNNSTNQMTNQVSNSNYKVNSSGNRQEGSPATIDQQNSRNNRASIKTQQKITQLQSSLIGNNNSLDRHMSALDTRKNLNFNSGSNSMPRTEQDQSTKQNIHNQPFLIPYFNLEEIRSYKPYISPSGNLKHDIEVSKIKIYKPFIIQNQVQLEFRNGDFMFLGVRISRPLQDVNSHQVKQLVYEKSQIFDEELIDIFPVLSQPKVFLREQIIYDNNKNQLIHHHPQLTPKPQLSHSMYFGFLIPKFKKTMPMDLNNLSNYIGFKHGLMLLYQFLDFMIRIHKKDHKFGHFDLSNLYFVENRGDQNNQINQYLIAAQASRKRTLKIQGTNESEGSSIQNQKKTGSSASKQKKATRFSLEMLFIDKNLQNLAILQNNQVLNQSYLNRYISQVTEQEQEQFVNEHLYQDFFCVNETVNITKDRSKSRENRWSARSGINVERSKSEARSISQHVIDQFKQELKELQIKIDKMKPNFEKSQNKVEIETLQIFAQVLLQYCHRIQPPQAASSVKKNESIQKNSMKMSSRSPKNSIISNPASPDEDTFDFLRRKDDVMRQHFYFEFMNVFNSHQIRTYSPAHMNSQIKDNSQTSGIQLSNSRISLPQSISNFEEKIFEKQLTDAKKICQNYIDTYENKQFWQNAFSIYLEDSQLQNVKIQGENNESPNNAEKQSFVSFSNYSRHESQSRAFIAQSQYQSSLINPNFQIRNQAGSLCMKVPGHLKNQQVQAHMKMLEDMMNLSDKFDNLMSPTRSNGAVDNSKQDSKITSNKTQISADSFVNQQSQLSQSQLLRQSYKKKTTIDQQHGDSKLQSLVSMQFENEEPRDNSTNQFEPSSSTSPQRYRSPAQPTVTPKQSKQKIVPKQNQLKNNLQRVDMVSCQEGLDSIVSGVGPRGEQSYINFSNKQGLGQSQSPGFGTLSGINGVGSTYRNSIRQNALQKVEEANEKLKQSNIKSGLQQSTNDKFRGQSSRMLKEKNDPRKAKPMGNFRDKDKKNEAGMKYLTSVKMSKLEDEPISEDEEEDDLDQDKFIVKQKQILAQMEEKRKENEAAQRNQRKQNQQDLKNKNQTIQKSNGIVHMVPQIKQKSKISSEGQSSSRVSRFAGASHVSPGSGVSKHSSPSLSPDDKSRSKLSFQKKSTISGRDSQGVNNSKSSVLVTSPRIHDRKSTEKLQTLKKMKNKNQISREENQKDYDDELDDHVDANDIVVSIQKDRSKKEQVYKGNNTSTQIDHGLQGSQKKEYQQANENDKQQIIGILKKQRSSVRQSRQQTSGHRFNKNNNQSSVQMQSNNYNQKYMERNKKINDDLANEHKFDNQHKKMQSYRSQGSMKLNSTQNVLGKALESQNSQNLIGSVKKITQNQQQSSHFNGEQVTSLGLKSSENRTSFGKSSSSQPSNFKQRQFNLQNSHRDSGSTNKEPMNNNNFNQHPDQLPRRSFKGYRQNQQRN